MKILPGWATPPTVSNLPQSSPIPIQPTYHSGPVIKLSNKSSPPSPATLGTFLIPGQAKVFITVRDDMRVIRFHARKPIATHVDEIKTILESGAMHGRRAEFTEFSGYCSHIAPLAARAIARRVFEVLTGATSPRSPKHSDGNTADAAAQLHPESPEKRSRRGSRRKRSSTEHAVSAANPRPAIT